MTCVICKQGKTRAGKVTITMERESMTLVVRAVPAQVCGNCGEEFVDKKITSRLLNTAADASRAGVRMDVREYLAA